MTHRIAHVVGIKPWKRWQIDAFLRQDSDQIRYASSGGAALREQIRSGGDLVVWAAREPMELAAAAAERSAIVIRMEDGFIRSVGLGSTHVGGASLVLDRTGICFDPARESDLEQLLLNARLGDAQLARAAQLRSRLVATGMSKYNVGQVKAPNLGGRGQRRILVPGQVENDASVRLGAPEVGGNLGLLQSVREANPEAWIIYKPHPDAEARTRPGWIKPSTLRHLADEVVVGAAPAGLLDQVDEVHTMTSLLGFEALLRSKPVTVWGRPFYSGWGLTRDRLSIPRRQRTLTLDELVHGVLIAYPRYVHPETLIPCEVEEVVEVLAAQGRADSKGQRSRVRRFARLGKGWLRSMQSRSRR